MSFLFLQLHLKNINIYSLTINTLEEDHTSIHIFYKISKNTSLQNWSSWHFQSQKNQIVRSFS